MSVGASQCQPYPARHIGVVAPRKRRVVKALERPDGREDPFRVDSGELSRLRDRRI